MDAGRNVRPDLRRQPVARQRRGRSLEWTLNGKDVLIQTFGTGEPRAWQEIVGKNTLKASDNKLTVRLTDKDKKGEIGIQDVVMITPRSPERPAAR